MSSRSLQRGGDICARGNSENNKNGSADVRSHGLDVGGRSGQAPEAGRTHVRCGRGLGRGPAAAQTGSVWLHWSRGGRARRCWGFAAGGAGLDLAGMAVRRRPVPRPTSPRVRLSDMGGRPGSTARRVVLNRTLASRPGGHDPSNPAAVRRAAPFRVRPACDSWRAADKRYMPTGRRPPHPCS